MISDTEKVPVQQTRSHSHNGERNDLAAFMSSQRDSKITFDCPYETHPDMNTVQNHPHQYETMRSTALHLYPWDEDP